ncbi:hypothetical protein [Prevotella intermedia]|uniref:hypothetical protein n=1 Tax=Prevotella intermedia TaxID=28131 RepID=UPI0015CF410D|nr:hypothetical protein [Prevotella intermedia]
MPHINIVYTPDIHPRKAFHVPVHKRKGATYQIPNTRQYKIIDTRKGREKSRP